MNKPQIKVNDLQINIKIPQQLHIVKPHSQIKQKISSNEDIPAIEQQLNNGENQDVKNPPHKIRHIQSIDDKGQFIDQTHHSRVSQNDQVRETINRTIYPQPQLPINNTELQKIVQQAPTQQCNSKPLKHINYENIQDKDEFNLRNSRQKKIQKKRRLSQSNLQTYMEVNNRFSVVQYLNEQQKIVPQKIIEEQSQFKQKQKQCSSPQTRDRRRSVHTVHRLSHRSSNGLSEQMERMIVDQLDKKKKNKIEQKNQQQKQDEQMEQIKEQKQEQDLVNTCHLEQARERIEYQMDFEKVQGSQMGPQYTKHLVLQKQETIKQDEKGEKDD